MPTSSRLDTRPLTTAVPRVGCVIRDRIFSSVDLPAPLEPMIPTVSPLLISKETSLSAQMMSSSSVPASENVVRFRRLAEIGQGPAREIEDASPPRVSCRCLLGANSIALRELVHGD